MKDSDYTTELIDALCVLHCGWNTDIERKLHDEAYDIVWKHKQKLLLEREIKNKTEQLEYLKTGKECSLPF